MASHLGEYRNLQLKNALSEVILLGPHVCFPWSTGHSFQGREATGQKTRRWWMCAGMGFISGQVT